jgi:hypothetical protein
MKMLFLAGICHELHPSAAFARLFQSGMTAVLPLLTRDGHFSYFGRTDNSPFAAGLTIFNLRKAARMAAGDGPASPNREWTAAREGASSYEEACEAAERYYQTFPRTPQRLLQSNRFAAADSPAEYRWSRDAYAYVGQYSLASCAYALLGSYWFPLRHDTVAARHRVPRSVAASNDLGIVKLTAGESAAYLRTRSELTSWDRRYLGPTILRYEHRDCLLVGAISKTLSTDAVTRPARGSRAAKAWTWLRDRFVGGIEQLDGTSVGFLPVLRRGAVDYLPSRVVAQETSADRVRVRYEMVRLHARGIRPCAVDAIERMHQRLPLLRPKTYSRPPMTPAPALHLDRDVYFTGAGCRIEDRISGNLRGKKLLFSVRHFPGARIRVHGLTEAGSAIGWGSDGRQVLQCYQARPEGSEIRYVCEIDGADCD